MGVLRSLGCRDRPDTQVSLLPGQHRSFLRCLVSTSQVCARYQRGAGKDRWGGDETRPRAQRGREGRHVCSECVAEADLVGTVSRGLPNRVTSELRADAQEGQEASRGEEKAEGAADTSTAYEPGSPRASCRSPPHSQESQLTSQGSLPASVSAPGPRLLNGTARSLRAAMTTWALPAGTPGYSMTQSWAHGRPWRETTHRQKLPSEHWPRRGGLADPLVLRADASQQTRGGDHSRTFCVHGLLHDDLHPLHVVPVPEAVQGLAVLVSERQDLGHHLPGKETVVLWLLSGRRGNPDPRKGPQPLCPLLRRDALGSSGPWTPGLHSPVRTPEASPSPIQGYQLFSLQRKKISKDSLFLLSSIFNKRDILTLKMEQEKLQIEYHPVFGFVFLIFPINK